MKIPNFKEINLTNYTIEELVESLKLQGAGQFPTFLVLDTNSTEETNEVLESLSNAFAQLNIHPQFPYPFYAITDKVNLHSSIPISPNVDSLPAHFQKETKRLKGKELVLLNKANLIKDQVVNLPIYERLNKLKRSMKEQKNLYRETKKLHFYETLLDRLNKRIIKSDGQKET